LRGIRAAISPRFRRATIPSPAPGGPATSWPAL